MRAEFDAPATVPSRPGSYVDRARRLRPRGQRRPAGDEVLAPGWTSYRHRLRYRTATSTTSRAPVSTRRRLARRRLVPRRLGFNGGLWDLYGEDVAAAASSSSSTTTDGTVEQRAPRSGAGHRHRSRHRPLRGRDPRRTACTPTGGPTPGSTTSAGRRPTVASALRLTVSARGADRSARPRGRGAAPGRRSSAAPTAAFVSTSGRTSPASWPSPARAPRGHDDRAPPRRGPRARRARRPPAAHRVLGRPLHVRRRPRRRPGTPRFTIHGFRYAEIVGWPDDLEPTSRPSRPRRALRHGPRGVVRQLARAAGPVPRERRVEHARQLRRPSHRLPAARRAARLDRRHPGLRARGRIPLRQHRRPAELARATSPPSRSSSARC